MKTWPTYSRRLFHHELDGDGICHFSNYYRIAEEALFSGLNELIANGTQSPTDLVMVACNAKFFRSLRAFEAFQVASRIATARRTSFTIVCEISVKGVRCALVSLELAAIDRASRAPAPLSKSLRGLLAEVVETAPAAAVTPTSDPNTP